MSAHAQMNTEQLRAFARFAALSASNFAELLHDDIADAEQAVAEAFELDDMPEYEYTSAGKVIGITVNKVNYRLPGAAEITADSARIVELERSLRDARTQLAWVSRDINAGKYDGIAQKSLAETCAAADAVLAKGGAQ